MSDYDIHPLHLLLPKQVHQSLIFMLGNIKPFLSLEVIYQWLPLRGVTSRAKVILQSHLDSVM